MVKSKSRWSGAAKEGIDENDENVAAHNNYVAQLQASQVTKSNYEGEGTI